MVPHTSVDAVVRYALENYTERPDWVNYSQLLRDHVFGSRLFKSMTENEDGGQNLSWIVQKTAVDNWSYTSLYDEDDTASQNNGAQAYVDWSGQKTSYQYDVNEPQLQGTATRIVAILNERESEMWQKWFENMEVALWTLPTAGASPQRLYGIPYYITKTSATSTGGFNGGAPMGYTTVANINPSTVTAHKNWNFTYAAAGGITRTDFVRKTLEAMDKTKFKAPMGVVGSDTTGPRWGLYTNYTPYQTVKELQEARNENLGADVGYFSGTLTIKGVPLEWVDALDGGRDGTLASADTSNPIYGINWDHLKYKALKGRNRVRTGPFVKANAHNVRVVFVDNWGQYQYLRRDQGFVGYGA